MNISEGKVVRPTQLMYLSCSFLLLDLPSYSLSLYPILYLAMFVFVEMIFNSYVYPSQLSLLVMC